MVLTSLLEEPRLTCPSGAIGLGLASRFFPLSVIPAKKGIDCKMAHTFEVVAKNIKALNHQGHEGHKGKEKLFFVLFVSFVVPFFSAK